ncbi:hypothetical protein ABMC88_01660 [Sulfitobacter sp. HNIBRBA2951]|uniref:hypothetical protein n=1 Tax=Sulfitobacter aquimarinus TaxID=3158557 RepID=UPI0032DFB404
MTTQSWKLTVRANAAETFEAMTLAGSVMMQGKGRVLQIVHAVFVGLFAPLGATMFVWVMVQMFGGPKLGALPVAALPLTLIAFGFMSMWLLKRVYFVVAEWTVASKFGRMQQVTIDAQGIVQESGHSRWHSGWADVAAVRKGKKTIALSISGVAIALPLAAFPDPPEAARALAAMQSWQEAAQ